MVDAKGTRPDIHFLRVPESKAVKNRVHLDLKPPIDLRGAEQRAWQEAEVTRLVAAGAVFLRHDEDCPVIMQDVEGNEFCVTGCRLRLRLSGLLSGGGHKRLPGSGCERAFDSCEIEQSPRLGRAAPVRPTSCDRHQGLPRRRVRGLADRRSATCSGQPLGDLSRDASPERQGDRVTVGLRTTRRLVRRVLAFGPACRRTPRSRTRTGRQGSRRDTHLRHRTA
ncbi:VOC family protein [Streptomyces himalayensis]|uniref:VOC family protein n=1 Tax=Streptomyces himalayensis TaxID=2820085 RepID=UPI0035A9494A